MRRFIIGLLSLGSTLAICAGPSHAQGDPGTRLKTLSVPAAHARTIATKLSIRYRDIPGVQISPDARNERLVVMAPEETQKKIEADFKSLMASSVRQVSARASAPLSVNLTHITWREFEDDLQQVAGRQLPVTTSRNGERAAFQLTAKPMQGTTVEVDRRNNTVMVIAPEPSLPGWRKMIAALDQSPTHAGMITEMMRLEHSEPAPIQRALRLLKALEETKTEGFAATPVGKSPFRNAIFQQGVGTTQAAGAQNAGPQDAGGQNVGGRNIGDRNIGDRNIGDRNIGDQDTGDAEAIRGEEGGAGVIGDTQIQFVPELGTIIIRGSKRDVQRVMDVIKEIEEKSVLTAPKIEVRQLEHANSNAVADLLRQLYEDVLSARQGDVSITSLDAPNALLLIGREEAILSLMELIQKIDQPVDEASRLRVFRLQNASAVDAEQAIRDFFTDRPTISDDPRPGVGARVRVLADYRTNSLIISAAPRDMIEITDLINKLDVHEVSAQNEIKVFPLNHAIAEELAPVLQTAINGQGEDGAANDNVTPASTTLTIVDTSDPDGGAVDSGILAGAVVTPSAGANSVVVRAPAASMSLIAELIRQLDKAPGIDSLVKVFEIKNGDAGQLTTALQNLFGADAATLGTSVGAANAAGLPPSTAAGESSLVPLTFSTDIRSNSIIASGSEEDLEVVESILLRLDGEGFAERITEVVWLRHQTAEFIAAALQDYVTQRTNGVNRIQQFQQGGLGPYDLPDRDLVVSFVEPTNSLLISVSPRLYAEVRDLIEHLDRRPPMVLIKVLIAEVRLDDYFEIGGEFGLQDSLLYDRGVAAGAFPGATPPSNTGFNFNNNGQQQFDADGNPLGNSFGQGNVAASTLTSFGLGATNSALGYGGFVLSAASDSVSLLLRTLQDSARLQILSRPQIMAVDNTIGYVQVGRTIARVTGVINNGVAGTQLVTEDIEVGLIMQVQPRVGADGLIVMDIDATRSDRDDNEGTVVPTGGINGETVLINDIRLTTAQSTIAAYSGQTVVFGGLIQKSRANVARRVPYVADIPILGHFFKYDQEVEGRTELLVVMTPMLVNGDEDLEYIKQVESSRMSWCLADVVEAHGDEGLSGGYGLWGPAVGGTIYPDLQPTVDNVIVRDAYPRQTGRVIPGQIGSGQIGSGQVGSGVPGQVGSEVIGDGLMIDSSQSPQGATQGFPQVPVDGLPAGNLPSPADNLPVPADNLPVPAVGAPAPGDGFPLPVDQGSSRSRFGPTVADPVAWPVGSRGPTSVPSANIPRLPQPVTIGDAGQPNRLEAPSRLEAPNRLESPGSLQAPRTNPSPQTNVRPATYPIATPTPEKAKQASWMDVFGRSKPSTDPSRPQPKRLGSGQ